MHIIVPEHFSSVLRNPVGTDFAPTHIDSLASQRVQVALLLLLLGAVTAFSFLFFPLSLSLSPMLSHTRIHLYYSFELRSC